MTHWGVEVFDLECVNGNWQLPAFPSSLMVCDVETGEALYPALGGAGGRTMSTILTIAAVSAVVFSGGTSLAAMGAAKGATVTKPGMLMSAIGKGKLTATVAGMQPTTLLTATQMQGLALGSVGIGVAAGLSGGITDMFAPPEPPAMRTFPAYENAPGLYDPETEAILNKEAQEAAYQEQVSEFNRRRQRFVSMKDERQPLGAGGELVPPSAVHKQQLLGA